MTKKIYFKVAVFLVAINILFFSNILANQNNLTQNEQEDVVVRNVGENVENTGINNGSEKLTDEEKKQIEELNNIIKELVKSIKSKLKTIDEKVENIRKVEEYDIYPAIRLNVDTPIFGLASVTNSKLKIKHEVSATDIAKGYSIRYIIKNNSIKLADKYIAGIIVSTKDVKFDENISLTDANSAVIKLMQYSKTLDNVTEFLDNQTNKILKGYIDKNKKDTITEIERKLNNLNDDLLKQDEKLLSLHILLTTDDSKQVYLKELETFNNISKRMKANDKKIKNILISNEDLVKVQKDVLELESTMIDFSIGLDKNLDEVNKNIDEKQVLLSIQKELKERKSVLDKIVENSVIRNVIKTDVDSSSYENIDSKINTDENDTKVDNKNNTQNENAEQAIEEIKKYDVVSKNILKTIEEEIINVIDKKVEYYIKDTSKQDSDSSNTEQAQENTKVEEVKISEEEKQQLIKDLVTLYKNFISKENKFYLDNINSTLKNTTSKISDLSKYTKTDILNQMRYIYLELPSALENYLDSTNLNSVIETRNLSNSFNKELNNLLKVYVKVDEIYNELNVENIKKNA